MRVLRATLAVLLASVMPLAAQSRSQPNLVLTMYGGAANGHSLWDIARQTLVYADTSGSLLPRDTVTLERRVNSAIVVGATMTLFPNPHVGLSVDIAYRGFSFDDTCRPIYLQTDNSGATNQRLCDNITSASNGGSVVGITAGGILRAAASAPVSPYLRGAVTFAHTTISTLSLAAPEALGSTPRAVIVDPSPRRLSLNPLVAAGLTTSLGTGYQLRLEVRDEFARLERMDASANALGEGPTSLKMFHHFALVIGLDVVLEQKRIRRY